MNNRSGQGKLTHFDTPTLLEVAEQLSCVCLMWNLSSWDCTGYWLTKILFQWLAQFFSIEDQTRNILGSVDHVASITTTLYCPCSQNQPSGNMANTRVWYHSDKFLFIKTGSGYSFLFYFILFKFTLQEDHSILGTISRIGYI